MSTKRSESKKYFFEVDESFRSMEKIQTEVFPTESYASKFIAELIVKEINQKTKNGEKFILGLATGSSPVGVYENLIRLYKEGKVSFKNVITFNLDEYYPMPPKDLHSYNRFMREYLFDHIDVPEENINIPDGTVPLNKLIDYCNEYEAKIKKLGGIDLQILGLGRTGHVGFNEPGSSKDTRTRLVYLDMVTKLDAASSFFGLQNVPRKAITMGLGTILAAKKIIILAFSEGKRYVVKKAVEGEICDDIPATYLQIHDDTLFVLDKAAGDLLSRYNEPWAVKGHANTLMIFDELLKRKAVIWLSRKLGKPISKLTEEDYEKNHLIALVEQEKGKVYELNNFVLNSLVNVITEFPSGKQQKTILIFSPHPDDDVICMAGTIWKQVRQGHKVIIAYQTSGNVGVFDHDAIRFADFAREFAEAFNLTEADKIKGIQKTVEESLSKKSEGQIDSNEVLKIKGLIRLTEARSAALCLGVLHENIHFLDLPFYQTGLIKKAALTEKDIQIIKDLLNLIKPDEIYAAGDLTDPHGTHRKCLEAFIKAYDELCEEEVDWIKRSQVFLYRGAWQEWDIDLVEKAVPLSPEETHWKRTSIFRHQSQKDRALFPGADTREFWQRAEERNRETAQLINKLGLQEYEAFEVFVSLRTVRKIMKF